MNNPLVPESYQTLIASSRVSTRTRQALKTREVAVQNPYQPAALTVTHFAILRAVLARVLPQPADARIDLAALLDAQLHASQGDGWRFAILPDNRTAAARALSVLDSEARAQHGQAFADLADDLQDSLLACADAGEVQRKTPDGLDGAQMKRWFEDLRGDAAKLYMAHPATLARIGYSGIGYGGDGPEKPGFDLIGLGERDSWEPMPIAASQLP